VVTIVESIGGIDYEKLKDYIQEVPLSGATLSANQPATLDTVSTRQFRLEVSFAGTAPTTLNLDAVSPLDPSSEAVDWTELSTSIPIASFTPPTDSVSTLSTDVSKRFSDFRYWRVSFDQDAVATISLLGKGAESVYQSVKSALDEAADIDISGTVASIVERVEDLQGGTIAAVKSRGGTIGTGAANAGVSHGTIDVVGFSRFTSELKTGGTLVTVSHQFKSAPGAMWVEDGTDSVDGTGLVTTFDHVGYRFREVPQDNASTLDVTFRGRA